MLRECYEKQEIAEVTLIPGDHNYADGMTKTTSCNALEILITSNHIYIKPSSLIERNMIPQLELVPAQRISIDKIKLAISYSAECQFIVIKSRAL